MIKIVNIGFDNIPLNDFTVKADDAQNRHESYESILNDVSYFSELCKKYSIKHNTIKCKSLLVSSHNKLGNTSNKNFIVDFINNELSNTETKLFILILNGHGSAYKVNESGNYGYQYMIDVNENSEENKFLDCKELYDILMGKCINSFPCVLIGNTCLLQASGFLIAALQNNQIQFNQGNQLLNGQLLTPSINKDSYYIELDLQKKPIINDRYNDKIKLAVKAKNFEQLLENKTIFNNENKIITQPKYGFNTFSNQFTISDNKVVKFDVSLLVKQYDKPVQLNDFLDDEHFVSGDNEHPLLIIGIANKSLQFSTARNFLKVISEFEYDLDLKQIHYLINSFYEIIVNPLYKDEIGKNNMTITVIAKDKDQYLNVIKTKL
jgi:hypothetical protein